jgi:Leucine-rich repeat (LRR) protein
MNRSSQKGVDWQTNLLSRPASATKIWKSKSPRTPERLLSEERLLSMKGWDQRPAGLSSHQILATSASINVEYTSRIVKVDTPTDEMKIREPPSRPRSGRFQEQLPEKNELKFDFDSSSSSDEVIDSNSADATKHRIKNLAKSFDKVSKLSAEELSGLLVPVRRVMTPDLRGSKMASVNGNMLIKRPIFGIGDMKIRSLSTKKLADALPHEQTESSLFVEEKNTSSISPISDVSKKKSAKKQQNEINQANINRGISQNAISIIASAQERVTRQREERSKPCMRKVDYSSSISLEFDKSIMKTVAGGKFGSMFGNLVAGAAGLTTSKTATASFLDIEMSEHATSIKEQYMLMCDQQRTNPKSALIKLVSTFGKQHSHNLNFTGCGFSDADFDAASIIFQNLTCLNSLHLHGNRLSTVSVTKFLDVVSVAGAVSNLQHIDISGVNFDLVSMNSLLELQHLKSLPLLHFIANDCTMGDPASAMLFKWLADGHCKTLTVLQLASNQCSSLFCGSVVRFSRRFSALETLNLSWNHIREHSAIKLVRDIFFFKNLTNLNLSWNGLGEAEVLDEFAAVLPKMKLKSLDLSFSRIDHESSLILCDAIRFATTIRHLNLAGNPLRMIGARNVMSAIVEASKSAAKFKKNVQTSTDELVTIKLNITSCSVGVISGERFDSENPFGEHTLDFNLPFDRSKMRAITRMVQRNVANVEEFVFDGNQTIIDSKSVSLDPSIFTNTLRGDHMIGIPTEGVAEIHVTLLRRNMDEHVMDPFRFDVIKNILNGTRKEQRPEVLRMITSGTAFFKYVNEMKELLDLCEDNTEKRILVGGVMNKVLALRPPPPVVDTKPTDDDDDFFANCQAPSQAAVASAFLAPFDVVALIAEQKRNIPAYIRMFTANNATGYYLIDLDNPVEAEFLDRLFSVQLDCTKERWLKDTKNRNGMLPINYDKRSTVTVAQRCFNRVFHDKTEQLVKGNLLVPKDGKLEIDFFDLRLPAQETLVLPATVIYNISQMSAPSMQLKAMRLLSNDYCFSLESCCALLAVLPQPSKNPGFDRKKKRRKSLSPTKKKLQDKAKHQVNQDLVVVEMVIIMWSRVRERHGVGYLMRFLSLRNQEVVTRRLGAHNVFDLVAAVGLYELDLGNFRHRYVAAELVRMAALEPGLNMVDCQYRNDNFEVPKGWTQDLPGKGSFVVHYCRSQQVQSQILNGLQPSGYHPAPKKECVALYSWPTSWDYYQPVGDKWVEAFKKERIRLKILSKFENAKAVFKHIDTDGGGSIDRRELHAGFLSVGIYLHPYESVALFRVIDEDESGDIDIGSWIRSLCWFKLVLLLTGSRRRTKRIFGQASAAHCVLRLVYGNLTSA